MATVGWVLFILTLLWAVAQLRLNHRKRLNLRAYIIYLLLADEIRARHKEDFQKLIRESRAADAMALGNQVHGAIENLADGLAQGKPGEAGTSSLLGTHALLWDVKKTL